MKKIIICFSTIFIALVTGSVQSIYADHSEPGQGIWNDATSVNIAPTDGSKYQIYLQVEVRDAREQLVSISESVRVGFFITDKITDEFFDKKLGEKEIITIDNIEYEKVQYRGTVNSEELMPNKDTYYHGLWAMNFCVETNGHGIQCIPIFQTNTAYVLLEKNDIIINNWTILREMN